MQIKKVLNSSVVLVTDKGSEDFIMLGKGIGYGKKQEKALTTRQRIAFTSLFQIQMQNQCLSY